MACQVSTNSSPLCLNHYHQLPPPFQHTTNTKNMTCHNQPHRVCLLFSSLFILLMSFPIYPALAQKTCHTGVFLCSTTPISHPSPSSMKNTPLWCIFCIHQSLQSLPVASSPSTPPLFLEMWKTCNAHMGAFLMFFAFFNPIPLLSCLRVPHFLSSNSPLAKYVEHTNTGMFYMFRLSAPFPRARHG